MNSNPVWLFHVWKYLFSWVGYLKKWMYWLHHIVSCGCQYLKYLTCLLSVIWHGGWLDFGRQLPFLVLIKLITSFLTKGSNYCRTVGHNIKHFVWQFFVKSTYFSLQCEPCLVSCTYGQFQYYAIRVEILDFKRKLIPNANWINSHKTFIVLFGFDESLWTSCGCGIKFRRHCKVKQNYKIECQTNGGKHLFC